jgi:hypothetical protein
MGNDSKFHNHPSSIKDANGQTCLSRSQLDANSASAVAGAARMAEADDTGGS